MRYHIPSSNEQYINSLPTQEVKYSDLQVEYSQSFETKEDIGGLQDRSTLPDSYVQYFDYLLDELHFDGKVLLGTGPEREEFLIYR